MKVISGMGILPMKIPLPMNLFMGKMPMPRLSIYVFAFVLFAPLAFADSSAPPSTQPAAIPQPPQSFDPADYLTGDWFGFRRELLDHGITIAPLLVLDDSQNLRGGIRRANSLRVYFDLPLSLDTEQLFGLHGGTLFLDYQVQHGGNFASSMVGSIQDITHNTDADNRSQLAQLWYEQKFFNDQFRIRLGKEDGNTDFDNLTNGQEFLDGSFNGPVTMPLPSYPDDATAIQAFLEPDNGFYFGAGVFDSSGVRGVRTGEIGPQHFFDRLDDLFLIAETGWHYQLPLTSVSLPGKIGIGGWWNSNHFARLDGAGTESGTSGIYMVNDQVLWKFPGKNGPNQGPNPTNPAAGEQEEQPGEIASCFSVSWIDPTVSTVDANALLGLTWTGPIPARNIDILGIGATAVHFSRAADLRDRYELVIETFYRIRFTQFISLKPDLQYILHPDGSGPTSQPLRRDALAATLRLEVAF